MKDKLRSHRFSFPILKASRVYFVILSVIFSVLSFPSVGLTYLAGGTHTAFRKAPRVGVEYDKPKLYRFYEWYYLLSYDYLCLLWLASSQFVTTQARCTVPSASMPLTSISVRRGCLLTGLRRSKIISVERTLFSSCTSVPLPQPCSPHQHKGMCHTPSFLGLHMKTQQTIYPCLCLGKEESSANL